MRAETGQDDDGNLATLAPATPAGATGQLSGLLPLARAAGEQTDEATLDLAEPAPEAGLYTRQRGAVGRFGTAFNERFRLANPDDPAPSTRRLLLVTLWSAALGLAGLLPAARASVMVLFNTIGPVWYPQVTVLIGLAGLACVAAAFASIHRWRLPFAMLAAATVLLIANVTLVYTAL